VGDNPLSIYAKAEQTLIEGVVYFDAKKILKKVEITKEREDSWSIVTRKKIKGMITTRAKRKKKNMRMRYS
jgi:hypothetical protein